MAERIVAGKRKPRLQSRRPGLTLIGHDKAGYHRTRAHRLRQPLIGIGQRRQKPLGFLGAHPVLGDQGQQHLGGGTVGLGKVDVEGDDRSAGLVQPVDELRDNAAGPRPLADFSEAVIVDVDDAYRRVPGLTR